MKLFSEEVQQTSTNSSHNILSVENFSEIFFDVFEIEINKSKYPVEKISDYEGNPVVSVPVLVGEAEIFYPFILVKGNFNVVFNENNTLDVLYPDGEFLTIKEKVAPAVEEELPLIDVVENLKIEVDDLSESKSKILEQIERAKREAERTIKESEKLKLSKISKENDKKEKLFSESLDIAREKLVHEFLSISDKIKEDIVKEFSGNYIDLKENIDHKLGDICQDLNKQLQENFADASNIFDNKIKSLVKELYLETVTPRVDNELKEIAIQIVDKVNEIESSLDKKLDVKAEKTLVEGVSKELLAIQKANIELNDSITKGVNKALSRAGNAKAFAEKIDQEIKEKISTDLLYIETYFDEKLKTIQEKTFDITEDSRKYIIDIVNKTKGELLEEIRKLPTEKPVEYIIESKKDSSEKVSVDKLKKEYDRVIHDKFENYKTDLRRYIAVYSGGGSVAQQFAAGGTIGGDLVIVGSISASQYLGIPSSGGGSDVSGLSSNWENAYTTVQSNSANWETSYSNLSTKANLNGGNTFTGNQAISGNLSATGINATGNLNTNGSIIAGGTITTNNGVVTIASPSDSYFKLRTNTDGKEGYVEVYNGIMHLQARSMPLYLSTDSSYTVPKVTILTNGNVGIGTSTPSYKLDLGTTGELNIPAANALRWGGVYTMSAGGGATRIEGSTSIRFTAPGDISKMHINTVTGNVGVGMSDANEKLTVVGNISATGNLLANNYLEIDKASTGNQTIYIGPIPGTSGYSGFWARPRTLATGANYSFLTDGAYTFFNSSTGSIFFRIANNSYMTIAYPNGNVGIATTTPNEKLTVVGNISATGRITSNGQTTLSAISANEVMTKAMSDLAYNQVYRLIITSTALSSNSTTNVISDESLTLPAGKYEYNGNLVGYTASATGGVQVEIYSSAVGLSGCGIRTGSSSSGDGVSSTALNHLARRSTGNDLYLLTYALVDGGASGKQAIASFSGMITYGAPVTIKARVRQKTTTDAANPAFLASDSFITFKKIS